MTFDIELGRKRRVAERSIIERMGGGVIIICLCVEIHLHFSVSSFSFNPKVKRKVAFKTGAISVSNPGNLLQKFEYRWDVKSRVITLEICPLWNSTVRVMCKLDIDATLKNPGGA